MVTESGSHAADADRYVTVSVAAYLTGIPERTLRRWAASGQIPAMSGQRGRLVDVDAVRRLAAMDGYPATSAAADGPSVATMRPVPEDGHETTANGRELADGGQVLAEGLGELISLLREKDQTILELAGRTGWLQAKLQEAEGRMQDLEQELRLLKAPTAAAADMPADQVPAETTNHPTEPENGPDLASYTRRSRPWWHFWAFW